MTVLQVQCVGSKSHTKMRHDKTKYLFVDVLGTHSVKKYRQILTCHTKKERQSLSLY
jgi:hypothetical protein